MGEEYEVERCPRCSSKEVEVQYDELGLTRLSLRCKTCWYIAAYNPQPSSEEPCDEREEWQTDPDAWKNDEAPD